MKLIFSEAIPSKTALLEPTLERLLATLRRYASPDGQASAIEISVQEAMENAIVHASGGKGQKPILVECFLEKDHRILLVVRDQGPGFDPAAIADPTLAENVLKETGRGIFLIRHLMDEVGFTRGGREIRMLKKLSE